MANKSIGQFIAALRKANGLTQQDVADRLNVSNKAVSRWERDECAPDISVIPALAEMFGVTCDELLKGERIPQQAPEGRKEGKVEKQLKALINRTLSGFKNLIWISLAVAVVGLVCMFGISYGFFRPVIGFAVMLLFETCALVIAVLAVNRARDTKRDNELFESAEETQTAKFNACLGKFSFAAFFVILSAAVLSVPLILYSDAFSVLTFESYLSGPFWLLALVLALVFFAGKDRYIAWITEQPRPGTHREPDPHVKKMSAFQLGAVVLACVLFVVAPWFETDPDKGSPLAFGLEILGLAALLANIVCFIVCTVRYRDSRKQLLLPGIRNALLCVSGFLFSGVHYVVFGYDYGRYTKFDLWDYAHMLYSVCFALLVFLVFKVIDIHIKRKHADS